MERKIYKVFEEVYNTKNGISRKVFEHEFDTLESAKKCYNEINDYKITLENNEEYVVIIVEFEKDEDDFETIIDSIDSKNITKIENEDEE